MMRICETISVSHTSVSSCLPDLCHLIAAYAVQSTQGLLALAG